MHQAGRGQRVGRLPGICQRVIEFGIGQVTAGVLTAHNQHAPI